MRQAMDPTPPIPHHLELNLPIRLAPKEKEKKQEDIDGGDEAADTEVDATTEEFPGYPALNPEEDDNIIRKRKAPSPNDDMSK
jgi:hypothetical protein